MSLYTSPKSISYAGLDVYLDVTGVDGDAARTFLRGTVDLLESHVARPDPIRRQDARDGRRQSRLPVVDVPDRSHVAVRLRRRRRRPASDRREPAPLRGATIDSQSPATAH